MAEPPLWCGDVPVRCYVGLGSNLDDPVLQVRRGLTALAALPDTEVVEASSLYRGPPMGPPGQPDYVNAVCALATRLPAPRLLAHLQGIEDRHGRLRGPVRWGPRILDLDLLLYGDAELSLPDLTVPHPGLAERAFVLYPLQEIAPHLSVPTLGPIASLIRNCPIAGLQKIGSARAAS
ncbi:MAG: 2-amino-4-hydroxy-6-hydroxymethyldihydropteridine diphosphokinase [Beggiatoa sp.]|nr:2-amino-4-hydroxy-6-hydroxymethyldihydropteridine diphosphokinase [Beggiatoa sp.]